MILEPISVDLTLTPPELAAVVEALSDRIKRLMKWSYDTTYKRWHGLAFGDVQEVTDDALQSYTKATMLLRELEQEGQEIHPEFWDACTLPDWVWDLANRLSDAKRWKDLHLTDRERRRLEELNVI